uniref:Chemokine interleukin-8-like domain-containing protein n=1 Tax=Oncorhynchus tshawytscha TaxID=74940 RepID=A0A8C8H9I9_ONCTS
MRTATLILFCATVFGAGLAHSPGGGSEKCQCRGNLMQSVRIKHIQKLQGYPKTVFCGKTELIVTMRNGKTKCLNPDGKQGKKLLSKKEQRSNRRSQKEVREEETK